MKLKSIFIVSLISALGAAPAHANWQYDGEFVRDGWYMDDGSRFTISVRGGASMGFGAIKNDVGSMTSEYYYSPDNGMVISAAYYDACLENGGCENFVYAGIGELSELPASQDYESFSFAAGASIGWTIPNAPQWRLELGWDHIAESEYNASPLYEGDLPLTGGNIDGITVHVQSGGVHSKLSADIISAMAFYDFFDGMQKPTRQVIPYVGFGVGYADAKTILNLSDLYGDLSLSVDLQNFGELDKYNVLQFYKSEKSTSTIAGLVAVGLSYGITDTLFLDFGARITYVPKVKWALSNQDGSRDRDWFSAENVIWANVMLGLRFEF
ncbi:MAG: hypothetical protein K2L95_04565 [Alphaproteobacteria bacterium]|nr:hypothetical protein [Alphaproteobacteria bacterium]